MRIGFVIYGSITVQTGGYIYDNFIVEGLKKRGHDVEVISLPAGPYLHKVLQGFSAPLYKQLRDGKFDVLVQDELCHPTLFPINRRLHRRKRPVIVALVHHILSQEKRNILSNKVLACIERGYLNSVDGFIHNSMTTKSIVTSLISQAKPGTVAYPAANRFSEDLSESVITERVNRRGPLELLFLGNIIPRKGLLQLLRTLHELDKQFWRLTIVGDMAFNSAHTQKVKDLITLLDMKDSVTFMGFLENKELLEVFKRCHIFCMPYAYEGFGMAMLEAMSFGLPAIASKEGAARETVCHDKNGYLIASDDSEGVQSIVKELYHDRSKLLQLSMAARTTSQKSPGWQDGVMKIEHFLQSLVGSNSNPGDLGHCMKRGDNE